MNISKFTQKSVQAVQDLEKVAYEYGNQEVEQEHLLEVDKAAREREEVILKQLEEKEPLPDKEIDQIAWVRAANQHRAIAEEIILKELIYV